MAIFLGLPTELTSGIISYFEHDKPTLLELSLVSHQFHLIAQKLVFRHAVISAADDEDPNSLLEEPRSVVRRRLLERSFRENGKLQNYIWSYGPIELRGQRLDFDWESAFYATKATLCTLESFPNMRDLQIVCIESEFDYTPGEGVHLLFESSQLVKLSSVTVERGGVEAFYCKFLPHIQALKVHGLYLPRTPMPSHLVGETSSLRTLEISGDEEKIQADYLDQLLSGCSSLLDLKCRGRLNVSFWGWPPPEYTFTTQGIQGALNHVQSTLTSLELVIPPHGIIQVEGDRIDLSAFRALQQLRISGLLLFRPGTRDEEFPSRQNVHRLLPRNLETLHIDCPPQLGAFYQFWSEADPFCLGGKFEIPQTRYEWILQFAIMKDAMFPKLRKVTLMDDEYKPHPGPKRMLVEWDQPLEISNGFADAGVILHVEVLVRSAEWKEKAKK